MKNGLDLRSRGNDPLKLFKNQHNKSNHPAVGETNYKTYPDMICLIIYRFRWGILDLREGIAYTTFGL